MRPASPIPSWRSKGYPPPFDKNVLSCSASVQDEIIASFDFYAEIRELGKELLRTNHHTNPAKSFTRFQAYIRQAKTFYETAAVLHHRASPLNYYYSFMNIAKALVLLRTPNFVDRNLKHGISPNSKSASLRRQRVIAKGAGVFPIFYEAATGKTLSNKSSLKIVDLLGYVTDVTYEYSVLKYGTHASFRTKLALSIDSDAKTGFPLLAVFNSHTKGFKLIEKRVTKSFDEVNIPQHHLRSIFELPAELASQYRYFEGKKFAFTTTLPINTLFKDIADLVHTNPFNDDYLFSLNCPIRTPKLTPMNEMLAIYIVMFFLGSLVRYRPDLLEAMLSTKDAWIIERFTKSAPLTFLRHARNMLDGKYLVYALR